MLFQRRGHKDVGNTCRALLHGTQQESKAHLQSCCNISKAGKKCTYLFIGRVLFVQMRWAQSSHCGVSENHLPRIRKRAKGGGCALQSSPGWHTRTHGCPWGALRPLCQDLLAKNPSGTAVIHRYQADRVFLSNTPCLVSFDVLKRSVWVERRQPCSIGTSNFLEQEYNHS